MESVSAFYFNYLFFFPPWIYIKILMDFFWLLSQRKDSTRRTLDFTIKNPKASLKARVGHLFM